MAKHPVGLPDDFSIKVSKEELEGPAKLPDYLDSDPMLEQLKRAARASPKRGEGTFPFRPQGTSEKAASVEAAAPIEQAPVQNPVERVRLSIISAAAGSLVLTPPTEEPVIAPHPSASVAVPSPRATQPANSAPEEREKRPTRKSVRVPERLQVNISLDANRKADELIELLNAQSSEKISQSDFIEALILSLYDARADINVGRLPARGQWGTPTARSFRPALTECLREAIVTFNAKQGGNPFKKVVGE